MMAEKTRLFQGPGAEELIYVLDRPARCKRIGRGVRNFDNAIWDRVREDAVLADTFAKFSQNPTMKQHLLNTGAILLSEAGPFDLVWGIDLRADDHEASNPRRWPGKNWLGKSSFYRPRRRSHN